MGAGGLVVKFLGNDLLGDFLGYNEGSGGSMISLSPDQFSLLSGLFEPLRFNLVVDSVIDGNTPGLVFADRLDEPAAGLIWDRQDAILLAGKFVDEMGTIIEEQIIPDARRRWIPEQSIFYPDGSWAAPLMERFSGYRAEHTGRRFYRFERLRVNWRERLPEGYGIRRIDPYLLESETLLNAGEMAGWVRSFWATDEDFARTGFGYCDPSEDAIASWCLTVFASRDQRELGVGTAVDQRGKGLATAVSAACVEHCLANGFIPHWHCLDENKPSWALAERIGFTAPVSYQVVRIHF